MDTHFLLRVMQLSCTREKQQLFHQLSFVLHAGEALWITGANGSGKSSLLRLLAGFSIPEQGSIEWCNQTIHIADLCYQQHIHYLGHENGIKEKLTVLENLKLNAHLFAGIPADLFSNHSFVQIDEVLSILQLNMHQHHLVCHLSAGQKRKLSLAKLLLFPRPLWILDEPFTALDAFTETLFLLKIEQHLKTGGIAIISSHHACTLPDPLFKQLRLAPC